jgi:lipid A ethanolaminephosphotransferase
LADQDIINFTDVSSCGTATAVSVPCLFSKFTRDDFDHSKGERYQNLLDVVSHAQYDVLWLDNNSGCQGVCERINYIDLAHSDDPKYCQGGNCVDEILLDGLQERVDMVSKKNKDQFIVLHQKGNHGPTYHRRYPDKFGVFQPICETNQLRSCSQQEVVNAYDNAILYTDYFLDRTIDFLKKNSEKYNTAMVYFSDHGESLGESNVYLHGLPYIIAPEYQKKVPFILWLSDEYQQNYKLSKACVAKRSADKLSHDNIFSSVLGLLAIETQVRDSQLDIFSQCKQQINVVHQY